MDFMKPLRRRRRQSALSCNVLFSIGGSTIARIRGNLCAQMSGLGCTDTAARPLLWCYAGYHLAHDKTICGAEVVKKKTSAPKIARGAFLSNVWSSFGGSAIARFHGCLCDWNTGSPGETLPRETVRG
jgi:hypothetical protein